MSSIRGFAAAAVLAVASPGVVHGAPAAPMQAAAKQASMVFVANTGLEDVQTLTSSLRHAIAAKKSGHLSKVVWMVYGRAIVVFDPKVKAVPDSMRKLAKEAADAGVEVVVCNEALKKYGIPADGLAIPARVVPNAITELAKLVSEGAAVLRY